MKQNFFAVDLGATSGRTILGTFIEGGLNLEEINRFPNHLIEVGGLQKSFVSWYSVYIFKVSIYLHGKDRRFPPPFPYVF